MSLLKRMLSGALLAIVAVGASAQGRPAKDGIGNHPLSPNEKGGTGETGPYEVVPGHFRPNFPAGYTWGIVAGVYAESPDRVYVYQRGILPALKVSVDANGMPARDNLGPNNANDMRREYVLTVYDRSGNSIAHWQHLDAMHGPGSSAHQIAVNPYDPEKHLWLVDAGENGGQILKVTRDGKLVMRIGPGKEAGCERPQDIAFLPNGDFWCVEGFDTAHVVGFSKEGKRLMEFGRSGTAPGEMMSPHSIAIDRGGRILIPEQEGDRIQVFDQNGRSVDIWPNIRRPQSIAIDKNDVIWEVGIPHRISGYDRNGRLLFSWGVAGGYPGQLFGGSQFDVDRLGNLYVAELRSGRVQMFRPKKGADPKQLIAWPLDQRQH